MKITPSDYTTLKNLLRDTVKKYQTDYPVYAKNGWYTKYRWDVLHKSGIKIGDGVGIAGNIHLYAYLNDSHIDTALRKIIRELHQELWGVLGEQKNPAQPCYAKITDTKKYDNRQIGNRS